MSDGSEAAYPFTKAPKIKKLQLPKGPKLRVHLDIPKAKKMPMHSFPMKSKASRKKSAVPKIKFNEF